MMPLTLKKQFRVRKWSFAWWTQPSRKYRLSRNTSRPIILVTIIEHYCIMLCSDTYILAMYYSLKNTFSSLETSQVFRKQAEMHESSQRLFIEFGGHQCCSGKVLHSWRLRHDRREYATWTMCTVCVCWLGCVSVCLTQFKLQGTPSVSRCIVGNGSH